MIHLNFGSNKGDRLATILRAVALIEQRLDTALSLSDPVETDPLGFDSANRFINVGAAFESSLAPLEIFAVVAGVEREIDPSPHRDAEGGYIDRAIDIDFIAADGVILESPTLQLPHPRMHLRDFVLIPMSALEPDWRHPLLGATPAELLAQ